ncbi:glycosyltransferase family 2 protein [Microvirga aerilata]|uniref:glycosyltransferase family 2 protein n=1 Tax=Microvirga aerilata TaxID=670292 RepID=UPI00363B952A
MERIVSQRTWLAAEQFDTILKCAHDLREKGWEQDAIDLEKALRDAAGSARTGMKLDIFDAQLHFWSGRYDLQLASINSVLSKQGLTPVQLKDESAPFACENLKSAPANPPLQGPLVSILVPAYNSAGTISYVLESLRNQTYRDFEVIVVDDASTDDTASIVAPFCDADPRFRLLSMGRNSGVFVARNMALASATGEFVTNQDADDWAHPQKIATAVAELRRDQSIIATWVDHVRCSKQRGFRALNGYFRPDASSLMFRQKPVLETIGYYDSVRAAGDGEFHLRMGRSFGSRSIRKIDKLLSFVSWSDASLSGEGLSRSTAIWVFSVLHGAHTAKLSASGMRPRTRSTCLFLLRSGRFRYRTVSPPRPDMAPERRTRLMTGRSCQQRRFHTSVG